MPCDTAAFRAFYARLITANAGGPNTEALERAFASTPREDFLGKGPWKVFTAAGYIQTPSDDPAILYQDILFVLQQKGSINNGQPSLHAACLAALNVREGEDIVHIGAGTGYYTAVLSKLTGARGAVHAYEIEPALAARAKRNLSDLPNVTVYSRSGSEGGLPLCDIIYVNAGATAPLAGWLDALRPGGRLLFPLTDAESGGSMLLVKRTSTSDTFEAQFLRRVMFIECAGARDDETAARLSEVFDLHDDLAAVRSLRRNVPPDETCWFSGENWWLSTR
jgi:protein-L-isoaspartate(D-aspartate) O-methyltransferase